MTQPSDRSDAAESNAAKEAWAKTLTKYLGIDGAATDSQEIPSLYVQTKTSSYVGYKSEILGEFLTHGEEESLNEEEQKGRINSLKTLAMDKEEYDLAALHTLASFYRTTQSPTKLKDLSEFANEKWPNEPDLRRRFLLFEVSCWYLLDNWFASTERIEGLREATEQACTLLLEMDREKNTDKAVPKFLLNPATHLHAILTAEWAELDELPISEEGGAKGTEDANLLAKHVHCALVGMTAVAKSLDEKHPRYYSTLARVQAASGEYAEALESAALSISYLKAHSPLASEFRGVQTDLKLRWLTREQIQEAKQAATDQIGASSKSARRSINRTKGEFLQLLGLLAAVIAFILVGTQTALNLSDPGEIIAVIGGSFGLMVLGLIAWVFVSLPGENDDSPSGLRALYGLLALVALFGVCFVLISG